MSSLGSVSSGNKSSPDSQSSQLYTTPYGVIVWHNGFIHWCRVTHKCVSKLYHHWFRWWFIVNKTLRNIFEWNFIWNSKVFFQEHAYENAVCKDGGHIVSASMRKWKWFQRRFSARWCHSKIEQARGFYFCIFIYKKHKHFTCSVVDLMLWNDIYQNKHARAWLVLTFSLTEVERILRKRKVNTQKSLLDPNYAKVEITRRDWEKGWLTTSFGNKDKLEFGHE